MSQEDYRNEDRREPSSHANHGGKRLAPSSRASGRASSAPERQTQPRPRKKRKRLGSWGILIYVVCVLGASVLLAGVSWMWANDILALNKAPLTAVVEIKEGDTVDQVADKLKDAGLIEYKFVFKLFCSFTHVSGQAGDDGAKITPGSYELNTDMDYRALISSMGSSSANRLTTTVTIPEGTTEAQIFEMLEKAGVATVEDLIHGVALRNGDGNLLPAGRVRAQVGDDGPVIHVGVQLIGAGRHLLIGVGEDGKEAEDQLELNDAIGFELIGHIVQIHHLYGLALDPLIGLHLHLLLSENVLRQGDDGGVLRLVEGQHIVGGHPAHRRQQGRDADDKGHIQQRTQQTEALSLPPFPGGGALIPLPGPFTPFAGTSSFLL